MTRIEFVVWFDFITVFGFMLIFTFTTFFLIPKDLFIGVFVALCVRVNQNGAQNGVNFNGHDQILSIIQQSNVAQIEQVCDVQFVYLNVQPILELIHFMSQDYHMLFRILIWGKLSGSFQSQLIFAFSLGIWIYVTWYYNRYARDDLAVKRNSFRNSRFNRHRNMDRMKQERHTVERERVVERSSSKKFVSCKNITMSLKWLLN